MYKNREVIIHRHNGDSHGCHLQVVLTSKVQSKEESLHFTVYAFALSITFRVLASPFSSGVRGAREPLTMESKSANGDPG